MTRTLLVPVDGSAFAEQALPLAVTLSRQLGARLELVTVWSRQPQENDGRRAGEYLDRLTLQIGSQLVHGVEREVLEAEASPLEYPPPVSNAVADELARHAQTSDASLIVMSTHGHGGVRRAWLGSVADSLIRMAPCPVLLVRPEDEAFGSAARADRGMKHILIPLDGSDSAEQAIPHALAVGAPFGARYTLLRVVSPLSWEVSPHAYDPYPVFTSPLSRDAVGAALERVAQPLRAAGNTVATQTVDSVSAGSAIVDFAAAHGVDLIVIGSGGPGPVRRLLLGSVADKVVRGSDVPVLVCNVRRIVQSTMEPAPGEAAVEPTVEPAVSEPAMEPAVGGPGTAAGTTAWR